MIPDFTDPFADDDGPEEGAQPTDDAAYEDYLIARAETEEPTEWPDWLPEELP